MPDQLSTSFSDSKSHVLLEFCIASSTPEVSRALLLLLSSHHTACVNSVHSTEPDLSQKMFYTINKRAHIALVKTLTKESQGLKEPWRQLARPKGQFL